MPAAAHAVAACAAGATVAAVVGVSAQVDALTIAEGLPGATHDLAHPVHAALPCTALSAAGAAVVYVGGQVDTLAIAAGLPSVTRSLARPVHFLEAGVAHEVALAAHTDSLGVSRRRAGGAAGAAVRDGV